VKKGIPMTLRDLSYLAALSKTLHFGKAAKLVHVSQPTLSVQIQKLEDRLGVILIERTNKSVRLTAAGEVIARKAESILNEVAQIKSYSDTLKDPASGELHLGIIPTLGPYLLPKIIPNLHQTFPKLALWLHEEQTKTLLEQLKEGTLDFAILSSPLQDDTLSIIPLFDEPFKLTVNNHHPLAKKKTVQVDDLENEKILLLSDGHCLRDQALSFCARLHPEPMSFSATSLETLRYMVAENLGVTLLPELATLTSNPDLVYIPFKKPGPSRALVLAHRHTHPRADFFHDLAKVIKKR
jgi:LysR family transcriptional regulator, hydrogen peroxide-inducible genes activator